MSTDAARSRRVITLEDLRAALPGFVAGRVLTGLGWLLAWVLVEVRLDGVRPIPMTQGLFAWDGVYYRGIAQHGYGALAEDAARFHPLLPLLGQGRVGLLVVANLAALLGAALVHRLVAEVVGDRDLARRAATIVGIAPPAFCLAWAYSEGLFIALTAGLLLALHRRWWWWVAVAGAAATLARPNGVLLVLPVLVAVWHAGRAEGRYVARAAALVAPGAAMLGWLWWVDANVVPARVPLRIQSELRDGTYFPPFRLLEGIGEVFTDPLGDGLHIPFAVSIVVFAAVVWVRGWPRSWAWFAVASAALFLSAGNLNSIERYALGTVPMVVASAALSGGRLWRPAVVVNGAGLVGMAALAWYGLYVP